METIALKPTAATATAGAKQDTMRALILMDEGWGANLSIEDEAGGIAAQLRAYGWEIDLASPGGSAAPCGYAGGSASALALRKQLRCADLSDASAYDALIVAPGKGHQGLIADRAALALLSDARNRGLALAAFCRGARVLAAAGVLEGAAMTGHPDYADEYRAAGARYIGYEDLSGKRDAPPPVVDGYTVTVMRGKYYRTLGCEALRLAAQNARRARVSGFGASAPPKRADAKPAAVMPADSATPAGMAASADSATPADRSGLPSFAFYLDPSVGREALLLAGSLRAFGGAMKGATLVAYAAEGGAGLPEGLAARLEELGCPVRRFVPDRRLDGMAFGLKVAAAAEAERVAAGAAPLVWLDADTVFLREPSELRLPPKALVGVRPVHHRLIGLPWTAEPDGYWRAAYGERGLAEAFPVLTAIDREPIWPYFNAGLLALRPEAGIARAWLESAAALTERAKAGGIQARGHYGTFLHQAALAGAILRIAGAGGVFELSLGYNYPAHMHGGCPEAIKPRSLDELYTLRYDRWGLAPDPGAYPIEATPRVREALREALARAAW